VFNRFSKSARESVRLAVTEAEARGDRRLGSEHLLLGLLHEPDGVVARALGVGLDQARSALHAMDVEALAAVGVDTAVAPAVPPRSTGHLSFTSAAKVVMERSLREAIRRKDRRIEPTHLLLALLSCERPDATADLLERLGVDPVDVRARLPRAAA
jgi:ATP-dependent Clp protease ATP-binding subunit ClpA